MCMEEMSILQKNALMCMNIAIYFPRVAVFYFWQMVSHENAKRHYKLNPLHFKPNQN